MRRHVLAAGLLALCATGSLAFAQSGLDTPSGEQYVPRLAEIMSSVQARHAKLWYAGKARNWDLARFELRQLRAGLADAAVLYSGIPVSNVTTLGTAIDALAAAIDNADGKRFTTGFGDLTDGCNACHSAMNRSFVVIRTPTAEPFGNQVFAPQRKR